MRDGDENVGGYVVVLSSVVQSRAVTLVSCYLADLGGPTAVSHMRLVSGQPRQVAQRLLKGLPGQSQARACLLDHAAELRSTLAEVLEHEEVSVELAEQRAADRREQRCDPKRKMTAGPEIADLDALRVLKDEDKQQDQHDRARHEAAERGRRSCPRRRRPDLLRLTGGRRAGGPHRGSCSRTSHVPRLGRLEWWMLARH